jgi:hypothetical protein
LGCLHDTWRASAFAGKIQQENLDAEGIMLQAGFPLPPLQQIGTTIFRRWVELI